MEAFVIKLTKFKLRLRFYIYYIVYLIKSKYFSGISEPEDRFKTLPQGYEIWTDWGMEKSISFFEKIFVSLDENFQNLTNKSYQLLSVSTIISGLVISLLTLLYKSNNIYLINSLKNNNWTYLFIASLFASTLLALINIIPKNWHYPILDQEFQVSFPRNSGNSDTK